MNGIEKGRLQVDLLGHDCWREVTSVDGRGQALKNVLTNQVILAVEKQYLDLRKPDGTLLSLGSLVKPGDFISVVMRKDGK